jgi:DNA-binding NtrC family response regulator
VRQHHGYVTVDSELGKGSTFKVFLPLTTQRAHEGRAPDRARSGPRGHGELILLVEDDQLVGTVLNDILMQHGYRVALARTGKEALRTWSEHGDEVDLVFTDAVMPGGLTGIEVLSSLRAKKPALKAILSSGYSPELVGENGTDPRVSFLQKPFSADQLLCRIRRVLDQ